MERILLHFDKVEADKKISLLTTIKDQLQGVCDEFTSLNPSFKISTDEVKTLFAEVTNPQATILRPDIYQIKSLILNRLLPDGKINGLPVNVEKFEELFPLPNTDNLIKKIRSTHISAIEFLNSSFYSLDKAGKIVIAPGAEQTIQESLKIYTETEEENERFEKAKALATALNEICSIAKNELNSMADIVRVVEFDAEDRFAVNSDFVKTGLVGQYVTVRDFMQFNNPKPAPTPAPVPENGFTNDFLKRIDKPEPTPEPSPVDFLTRLKSINL